MQTTSGEREGVGVGVLMATISDTSSFATIGRRFEALEISEVQAVAAGALMDDDNGVIFSEGN